MRTRILFIKISVVACWITCIGEFLSVFILGAFYPGYDQLTETVSSLGASLSPVSAIISAWWIIMGMLMILFGIGFRIAFSEYKRIAGIGSWLIILYGIGEGLGSGLFKADHIANGLTLSAVIHNIFGGIGVVAILLFPLVIIKMIPKNTYSFLRRISYIVFVCGFLTIFLFLFRYSSLESSFLCVNKGLWQRLFMLNTYVYLAIVAWMMIRKKTQISRN
jgi:hypothetical protein